VPADEVVEVVARAAQRQPLPGAEEVGAEGDDQRRLSHHVLPRVQLIQRFAAGRLARQHHRDAVEVAAGGAAGDRLAQHGLDQRRVDGVGLVLADRAVAEQQGSQGGGVHACSIA